MSRIARMCCLDRLELPERHVGVRGVLAVDGEQPRIVREARADPADARARRPRRSTPCPRWSSGSRGRSASCVRSARFCLPQSIESLQALVAGERQLRVLAQRRRARRSSPAAAPSGLAVRRRYSLARPLRASRPSRRPRSRSWPSRRRGCARGSAGARRCRGRTGRRRIRSASAPASGPAAQACGRRRRARRSRRRCARRAACGSSRRPRCSACATPADAAGVAELQRGAVERARVGDVVARVRDRPGEAPRVLAHQLGVRVDADARRLRAARRVRQLEAEQRAAAAVGHEVGPLEPEGADRRELRPGVAPAAREAGGLAGPFAVDAEVERVEQLERRRDDPAHLTGDVPAVGVEPAVLEPEHLSPRPGRHGAAVLEPVGDRQLGRRRPRRPRGQGRQREADSQRMPHTHVPTSLSLSRRRLRVHGPGAAASSLKRFSRRCRGPYTAARMCLGRADGDERGGVWICGFPGLGVARSSRSGAGRPERDRVSMSSVLVAYASKHGATAEIASAIAETLASAGLRVECVEAAKRQDGRALRRRRGGQRRLHGPLAERCGALPARARRRARRASLLGVQLRPRREPVEDDRSRTTARRAGWSHRRSSNGRSGSTCASTWSSAAGCPRRASAAVRMARSTPPEYRDRRDWDEIRSWRRRSRRTWAPR